MSASSIAMGILIPADMSVAPSVVPVADHHDLQGYVGGIIDAVTNGFDPSDFGHDDEDPFTLVGYVHDEGLLIGLDTNDRASVLFERTLVGDVVVVSGTNPFDLEYDGYNYDVPEWFRERLMDGSLEWVVKSADHFSGFVATTLATAIEDGLFTIDQIEHVVKLMGSEYGTLDDEQIRLVNDVLMTCMVYHKGRELGLVHKHDPRGDELLEQGVTDEMIAEFFRTELGGE